MCVCERDEHTGQSKRNGGLIGCENEHNRPRNHVLKASNDTQETVIVKMDDWLSTFEAPSWLIVFTTRKRVLDSLEEQEEEPERDWVKVVVLWILMRLLGLSLVSFSKSCHGSCQFSESPRDNVPPLSFISPPTLCERVCAQ